MRCWRCDYDLSNTTEHRCPECGRAFDPENEETYATTEKLQGLKLARALLIVIFIVLFAGFFVGELQSLLNPRVGVAVPMTSQFVVKAVLYAAVRTVPLAAFGLVWIYLEERTLRKKGQRSEVSDF